MKVLLDGQMDESSLGLDRITVPARPIRILVEDGGRGGGRSRMKLAPLPANIGFSRFALRKTQLEKVTTRKATGSRNEASSYDKESHYGDVDGCILA